VKTVARMPKYELLRNKLLRDAKKQPKPSKIWLFVNSGIFLWFLSASLLTVGGGYVTSHQACMREADQLIDRRDRLSRELYGRRVAFHEMMANARSVKEMVIVPTTKGSIYPDLEKTSYNEVEQELRKLGFRIDYDELPDDPVTRIRDEMQILISEYIAKGEAVQGLSSSKSPTEAEIDKFLQQRKLISRLLAEQTDFDRTFENYAFSFEPDCTIAKTFDTALGNRPEIIRAVVDPRYSTSELTDTMRGHLERANALQKQIMAIDLLPREPLERALP
jgi:hypothetical protein